MNLYVKKYSTKRISINNIRKTHIKHALLETKI